MPEFIWRYLARFLARPAVTEWIINRALRTPYDHLIISDGRVVRVQDGYTLSWLGLGERFYMKRWWLLRLGPLQIRVHNILSEDIGRDMHNHPWYFRTFILRGWYTEDRLVVSESRAVSIRKSGDTAVMRRGDWHRINNISDGGVWTLFVTIGKPKSWGFRVNGETVDHNEYTG